MTRNYWGYRTAKCDSDFFASEIERGVLRQGWGYDPGQDLRSLTVDEGASRNLSIMQSVKRGDVLLVMHVPQYGHITIVEATEDFDTGYRFEISEHGDYGHMFPVRKLRCFSKGNILVNSGLQTTFKCRSRFWSVNHCAENIDNLINARGDILQSVGNEDRLRTALSAYFKPKRELIREDISKRLNDQFSASEWEYIFVEMFQTMYPQYVVERTGGTEEAKHGTDILIRMPSIATQDDYLIAIQVKDFTGQTSVYPVDQVRKAREYWGSDDRNGNLVELIVIVIGSEKDQNKELDEYAHKNDVRVLYKRDVDEILLQYALGFASQETNDS